MAKSGRFIVLEGGEGAGKSSVGRALVERLRAKGHEVVATREPGGTPLGERVRGIVLAGTSIDDPLAELMLFEAARAHLVSSVIRPALDRGSVVVCDRYTASSVAYQAFGRGLEREIVARANAIATGGLEPAITLLLDLPVEAGLARRSREGAANHFDAEAAAFHDRVRTGFLTLARESPDHWRIIDASQALDAVIDAAWEAVAELLTVR